MSAKLDAIFEARARAIRECRMDVEQLSLKSEELRQAIDDFETSLNALVNAGGSLQAGGRIRERLTLIRQARNGMECFALKCLATESLDVAWKELP